MGNEGSRIAEANSAPGTNHSPLPEDPVPYGSMVDYRTLLMHVKLKANVIFLPSDGTQLSTSDVSSFFPTMQQQTNEYYRLSTFFKVPFSRQRAGFTSATFPHVGVFYRMGVYNPAAPLYSLHIEETSIQFKIDYTTPSIMWGFRGLNLNEEVRGIYELIEKNCANGGRLVCMETTGEAKAAGMFTMKSPHFSVNIFFEIPKQPNPIRYSYTCVNVPLHLIWGFNALSSNWDYNTTLSQYLMQGWKLVDIFIAQEELMEALQGGNQNHHRRPTQFNTMFFFEKETAQLQTPPEYVGPRYQVTTVTYYTKVQGGFSGNISSEFDIGNLLVEMGKRGWELTCIVDVPGFERSGMMSAVTQVLLFFQRPLKPTTMAPPQPMMEMTSAPPAYAPPVYEEASAFPTKQ